MTAEYFSLIFLTLNSGVCPLTTLDVPPQYSDVSIPVRTKLFVPKTQSVPYRKLLIVYSLPLVLSYEDTIRSGHNLNLTYLLANSRTIPTKALKSSFVDIISHEPYQRGRILMTKWTNKYNEFFVSSHPSLFVVVVVVVFFVIDYWFIVDCWLILSMKKRESTNFNGQPEHSGS